MNDTQDVDGARVSINSAEAQDNVNEYDLKRHASTSSDDSSVDEVAAVAVKRAKTDDSDSSVAAPPALDLALTLGYKEGDRIEAQWEIEKQGETQVHWWGATLLKHDGRTTDSVAIRTIEYDRKPELGFDSCREDVIFLGDDLIVSPDSQTQLKYRREGYVSLCLCLDNIGFQDSIFWYSH
jgi:hypothetical protein